MDTAVNTKYPGGPYAEGRILADVEDGVGLITFNQPEKRNAMSVDMWEGMVRVLDAFAADDAVRVVVLTGAGPKAFVSGADISQFGEKRSNAEAQREYDKLTSAGRATLSAFSKPVIARIRGFCLGGGLGIAMGADLRIAAESSEFGIPAARLGIAYGFDMTRKLVSLVGPANAQRVLFTGARLGSAEALRIGLINQVVPDEALSDTVAELARSIADNAPLSVRAAKRIVAEVQAPAPDRGVVDKLVATCFDSADYTEGRTAFMEKRRPKFQGR